MALNIYDDARIRDETRWRPNFEDRLFMRNLISILRDKGVWNAPCNGASYQVDHYRKQFTLVRGPRDYLFYRNHITARCFGYKFVLPDVVELATGGGKTNMVALSA